MNLKSLLSMKLILLHRCAYLQASAHFICFQSRHSAVIFSTQHSNLLQGKCGNKQQMRHGQRVGLVLAWFKSTVSVLMLVWGK